LGRHRQTRPPPPRRCRTPRARSDCQHGDADRTGRTTPPAGPELCGV